MKKKAPEKDNSERYLLTYSDLMNLLLILFIVLYASSKTDVAKAAAVAESIRKGFNATVNTSQTAQSPTSSDTSSMTIAGNGDYSGFYDQLLALISQAGLQNQVSVTADSNDVIITLKDTALYPSGSADINAAAGNLIVNIGRLVQQVPYALIMVEGYTDSDPIRTAQFADNLQLSTERANNVYRVLGSTGIPSDKMVSVGYGDTHPIASNDTIEHKAQNRRVTLTIMKSTSGLTPSQIIVAKDLLNQPGLLASAAAQATATITPSSSATDGTSASASVSSSKTSSSKTSSSKTSSSKSSASSKVSSAASSKAAAH